MTLRAVVAIPAKDEAERIRPCLTALAEQREPPGQAIARGQFGVVLLAADCRDRTAAIALEVAAQLPYPLRVVERAFEDSQSHAGRARREAMDIAAGWLEEQRNHAGLLLTTDADSRVSPNWISANLAAIDRGADAVAGSIALDPAERARLPEAIHRRGRLEAAYEELLIELRARLHPDPHDPWPHHATTSGASLAVTLRAYRRIGGVPPLPLGEDRALITALHACDARVRHDPAVHVITSGRLDGRALGGVADTLRLRSAHPDARCDAALEPVSVAIRRAIWRQRLRRLHSQGRLADVGLWAKRLGIHPLRAACIAVSGPYFGAAWTAIESSSLVLRNQCLTPCELPEQIMRARRALDLVRDRSPDQCAPEGRAGSLSLVPA